MVVQIRNESVPSPLISMTFHDNELKKKKKRNSPILVKGTRFLTPKTYLTRRRERKKKKSIKRKKNINIIDDMI